MGNMNDDKLNENHTPASATGFLERLKAAASNELTMVTQTLTSFFFGKTDKKVEKQEPTYVGILGDNLDISGNKDTKILAKAFTEISKDGLNAAGRETIEKIDDLLNGADIIINKDGNSAIIAQDDGKSFNIQAPYNRSTVNKKQK